MSAHDPLARLRLHLRTCRECKAILSSSSDLNEAMLCEDCGEPDEDPDSYEPSALDLWKMERTW